MTRRPLRAPDPALEFRHPYAPHTQADFFAASAMTTPVRAEEIQKLRRPTLKRAARPTLWSQA